MQRRTIALVVVTLVLINSCLVWSVSAESLGERTLKVGLSGDDVIELQRLLKERGFFSANLTGYYGQITRAAVINFQQYMGLTADGIAGPQTLSALKAELIDTYVVQAGDSLWKISQRFGISIEEIKNINNLSSNYLYVGQRLKLSQRGSNTAGQHIVQSGETLWLIANQYHITVEQLKAWNNLSSNTIYIGQRLNVGGADDVQEWPDVTYIVQAGDSVSVIAAKFGTSTANILKYNYMEAGEWLNAGEKIAISGYAPRVYTVTPGEASSPATLGKRVDWFLEGQYLIKRWHIFTIVDCQTGKQFKVKMMGGYNHSDIEPLTANDTAIIKALFDYAWTWSPRPVVVFHEGMNIAASLSGMPHSADTLAGNQVMGHFDLYLWNSKPHSSASSSYVNAHAQCVDEAAGN